jgi:ribonucleotide monophosphatase NagD (HAD superfamily)
LTLSSIRFIDRLSEIADRYDGFIFDLWGVVHNGKTPYPS